MKTELQKITECIESAAQPFQGHAVTESRMRMLAANIQALLQQLSNRECFRYPIEDLEIDTSGNKYMLEDQFWQRTVVRQEPHDPGMLTVLLPFIPQYIAKIQTNITLGDKNDQHNYTYTDIDSELTDYTSGLNW